MEWREGPIAEMEPCKSKWRGLQVRPHQDSIAFHKQEEVTESGGAVGAMGTDSGHSPGSSGWEPGLGVKGG